MKTEDLIELLKANLPVDGQISFFKDRVLCQLCDHDYNNHLAHVIRSLQLCISNELCEEVKDRYLWVCSTDSRKSMMVKLCPPDLKRSSLNNKLKIIT